MTDHADKPTIHIALCTDDNYLRHTAAAVQSAIAATPECKVHVHLVFPKISEENLHKFQSFVQQMGGLFSAYPICEKDKHLFHVTSDCRRLSAAAYYRIFLEKLLPTSVSRVLYMDGDIVVCRSLAEMLEIDLTNKAAAVVRDINTNADKRCVRLGYSPEAGYFNSGVLLLNLDYWRKHQVLNECIRYFHQHPARIIFDDQDLLNAVLHDRVVWLSFAWNAQDLCYRTKGWRYLPASLCPEDANGIQNPLLVHFTGPEKPWHWKNLHPFRHHYFRALSQTPWAKSSLRKNFKQRTKQDLRRFITAIHCTKRRYLKWKKK